MRWRRFGSLLVVVVGLGNMVAEPLRALRDPRDTDYASFVSAARILAAGSRNLYSLAAQHAAESAYLGFTPPASVANAFLNPAPAALALVPLTGLPRGAGLAIFLAIAIACVAASVALVYRNLLSPLSGRWRLVITAAVVCSLPAGMTLALAQWDPFILAPLTLALVWLSRDRRHFAAGVLLSAAMLKPQLGYLIPVFLVAARQWRAALGMLAGGAAWLLGSFAILGDRLVDWPRLVVENDSATTVQTLGLPGLAGMLTGSTEASFVAWLALSAVIAGLAFRFRRLLAAQPAAALAIGIGASLLAAPHLWSDDLILLALPLAWWARSNPRAVLTTAIAMSAAWGVDVAVGPVTGPHLETFVLTAAVAGLALCLRRPATAANAPVAWRRPATSGALPSTPR